MPAVDPPDMDLELGASTEETSRRNEGESETSAAPFLTDGMRTSDKKKKSNTEKKKKQQKDGSIANGSHHLEESSSSPSVREGPTESTPVASLTTSETSSVLFEEEPSSAHAMSQSQVDASLVSFKSDKTEKKQWNLKVDKVKFVNNMFVGTACPNTSDPVLDASPPGPFCHNC